MSANTIAANQPVFNQSGLLDANIPAESEIQRSMLQRSEEHTSELQSPC